MAHIQDDDTAGIRSIWLPRVSICIVDTSFNVSITYDGTTLHETVVDAVNGATFSHDYSSTSSQRSVASTLMSASPVRPAVVTLQPRKFSRGPTRRRHRHVTSISPRFQKTRSFIRATGSLTLRLSLSQALSFKVVFLKQCCASIAMAFRLAAIKSSH